MGFTPRPGESYTIRRKILTIFGAKFHVYDNDKQVVAFCKQKAFKLREDIRLYTNESMNEELYALRTQQIIDFGATYNIVLPTGETLGSFRRKGLKSSFVRDEWTVFNTDGTEIATLRELGSIGPIVRRYIDNVAVFMPQTYSMTRNADGVEIARFRQHFNPFVYRQGIEILAADEHMDELVLLAAGTLIAAIEGRQS
ncbi:MAG: hypothetical protein AB8F26_01580 [Phycisphaerales bacterium]